VIKVGVVDFGASGNLASVVNALEYSGAKVARVSSADNLDDVSHLVMPGVGSFSGAMASLEQSGWKRELLRACENKPVLGICLGMQIMANIGFEFGETRGLNLVSGEVKKVECKGSVPHVGFNRIKAMKASSLLSGIDPNDSFYFMHSYELINYTDVLTLSSYADHQFVSAVERDNVFGVQFHPEKSRTPGIKVLKNFLAIRG